jgi:hypothetical protein
MKNEILTAILSKGSADLAITLFIIAAFVWLIALAVVFTIKATRSKKIFGAEFDPEKPQTERRKR